MPVLTIRKGFARCAAVSHVTLLLPVVAFASLLMVPAAHAQSPPRWKAMVDGLSERGYYDTARDYLQWIGSQPFCPPDLKAQMDYQLAMVHLRAMESKQMFENAETHLKICRELLAKFLKENPDSEFAFETNLTLGQLLLQDGRIALARSTSDATPAAERAPLVEEARKRFQAAQPYFDAAAKLSVDAARKTLAAGGNPDTHPVVFGRVIAGKIGVNLAAWELAKSYPPGSDDFKKRMNTVAEAFWKIGNTYGEYVAGFEAKLFAARAYRELGNTQKTREILAELNVLSGEAFMHILTGSLLLTLDMNLAEKKYPDSISRVAAWAENASTVNKNGPDGQTIYLKGAETLIAYAESIQAANKAEADKSLRTAGVYLRQIRPTSGDTYRDAQKLLAKVGTASEKRSGPVASFADAREQADEDFRSLILAVNVYREATEETARNEAAKKLFEVGAACERALQTAILLKEADTPIQEVNRLRTQLVNAYNICAKRLEAAILADFIARRYSGEPDADKMASVAIKLFRAVFADEKNQQKKNPAIDPTGYAFALDRLAHFVMQRWPDREVADEVKLIQITTLIESDEFGDAAKLIDAAPVEKPYHAEACIRLGLGLWGAFNTAMKQPEESRPAKSELTKLLTEAKKRLESGLDRQLKLIESGAPIDWLPVHAAVALTQIALNQDDSEAAVRWLNQGKIGPATVVKSIPPGLTLSDLRINETLKLGIFMMELRAYVGAEQLDKAEATMQELEALIKAEHGDDDRKLTAVYVSLGRQLEERLKELTGDGDVAQRDRLTKGFEMFLKRIRDRKANTFQSLYWVADTYYRLGNGLTGADGRVPEQAQPYFTEAARTYVTILKTMRDEENWASPKAENTITARLAESLRCGGKYELAIKYLQTLLEETETRIDFQMEAARTYQSWGREDPKMYLKAILGGSYDNDKTKRQIWGWNGIIRRISNNIDRLRDEYYGAYDGKFRCCILYAAGTADAAEKKKLLEGCEKEIARIVQLRPDVGGEDWFPIIDKDLKDIRKALGQAKPAGLKDLVKELGTAPSPATPAAAGAGKKP